MSNKPIFVATHPRACSTAFERVFMTRRDTIQSVHEPFGDAYYFGPERLAERYEHDADARKASGFADATYRSIFDDIARASSEGKRVFVKDMAQYWIPPNNQPASIAPSLSNYKRGVGTDTTALSPSTTRAASTSDSDKKPFPYPTAAEPGNPTVIPRDLLAQYHFTFLIRHPRHSIPSYYRCTVPPLDEVTGFHNFRPDEAGYAELRVFFDYLRSIGQVGPKVAGQSAPADQTANASNGDSTGDGVEIVVLDADDLLDNPSGIIRAYCASTGIPYEPDMLTWDSEAHHEYARTTFEKWKGFHDDAIASRELKARTHKKTPKSDEQLLEEWTAKFGAEGAKVIAQTVQDNIADYEYLKGFAVKV